jgi:hypothetical protein
MLTPATTERSSSSALIFLLVGLYSVLSFFNPLPQFQLSPPSARSRLENGVGPQNRICYESLSWAIAPVENVMGRFPTVDTKFFEPFEQAEEGLLSVNARTCDCAGPSRSTKSESCDSCDAYPAFVLPFMVKVAYKTAHSG